MLHASLKVVGGKHDGELIPLHAQFLIGRESDCDLRPNSDMISRHHCALSTDDFGVRIRDLGSTNGTLVNGERIRGVAQLKQGDRVTVGKLEFEIQLGKVPPAAKTSETGTPALQSETAELSSDETKYEIPAFSPPGEADAAGETAVISAGQLPPEQPAAAAEPAPAAEAVPAAVPTAQQPQPAAPLQNPVAQQPGFQYPVQYPQQPAYYPPGMGYPAPGYYPQQPYPYPQPVAMGQPPAQPAPAPQPVPPAVAPTPTEGAQELPAMHLPDPASTGVDPAAAESGSHSGNASTETNPSEHAAEIIRKHLNRRPTLEE